MAIHIQSLATLLLLLLAASAAAAASVHDMLLEYGLPRGLLPDSVKSYSVSGNGEFEVEFAAPCYVQFSDLVYYEKKIMGRLAYGSISDLSGIQAKKLFFWAPITGIVAHPAEGTVDFQVGVFSETLPVDQFADIRSCRSKAACRGAAALLPEVLPIVEVFHIPRATMMVVGHGQTHPPNATSISNTSASPSPFSPTATQGHATCLIPMSAPGINFTASTPSPAASGGVSSVFRDAHLTSSL